MSGEVEFFELNNDTSPDDPSTTSGALPKDTQVHHRDVEEAEHFDKIVDAFLYYKIHSLAKLKRELLSYKRLPKHHQALIPRYVDHISRLRQCISANYEFLKTVVDGVDDIFENQRNSGSGADHSSSRRRRHGVASDFNMEKLQSTLKQFARDWSAEGVQGKLLPNTWKQ